MTENAMTAALAESVMGWGVRPDRFVTKSRGWMPHWRFQPTRSLADAFRLLEKASPDDFTMRGDGGLFHVTVSIGGRTGEASGASKPHTITLAVARAVGIEVNTVE